MYITTDNYNYVALQVGSVHKGEDFSREVIII